MLVPYIQLMRLNRPIGILLLLWPTLWAAWLASAGRPDFKVLLIFVLGVIIMRSAGCVINDYADQNFDQHVLRTKNRPLVTGKVSRTNAKRLFIILLSLAFVLALQLNFQTILLSFIGAGLAIIYPFAKRFTGYPQFILGMAFSWAIPMVYMQIQHTVPIEAWLLYASNLCWVVAYDTEYAMADREDDLRIGIKSTAITFASYDKIIIFLLQISSLLILALIGMARNLNLYFYLGLLFALMLTVYQQYMIQERNPPQCLAAFLQNNYFGMAVFVGILMNYWIPYCMEC